MADFRGCIKLLVVLTVSVWSAAAVAAKQDYQRAINLAGEQRALTQKMSKEALLVAIGIDSAINRRNLKATQNQFALVLRGLRFGDLSLGLPATTNQEILEHLADVEQLWAKYESAILQALQRDHLTSNQVEVVASLNLPLLEAMDQTVRAYERNALGGTLFTINAAAINQSQRQRMLTQKMTKEFLLITYGYDVKSNKRYLGDSISLFDELLSGLIHGNSSLRLPPAPTPELQSQFEKIARLWQEFRPLVQTAAQGGSIDAEVVSRVARLNRALFKAANTAVYLYESL